MSLLEYEKNIKRILFRPTYINKYLYKLIIPKRLLGSKFISCYESYFDIDIDSIKTLLFNLTVYSELIINHKKIHFDKYMDYYDNKTLYKVEELKYKFTTNKIFINKLVLVNI